MTAPVLGIETSCDETAAALVAPGGRVLSSIVASQHDLHAEYGGVVPEIASRAHIERIAPVVHAALQGHPAPGAVAVGHRPGLIGSLIVGVGYAKALAWSLGVPLIGIDHVRAHLYAAMLDPRAPEPDAPPFPALGLVVSGGHSSLHALRDWRNPERIGSTIDDAMGEAFDKAAVILGLPHPGGPNLDRLASTAGAEPSRFAFPISRLGRESLDFSFSGLKTAVLYAVRGVPDSSGVFPRSLADLGPDDRRNIAAAFQHAAVAAVVLKLARAADHMTRAGTPPRALVVGGGVAANSRLRAELACFARERGLTLRLPALEYCVDNAAMIAGLGERLLADGQTDTLELEAIPTTSC